MDEALDELPLDTLLQRYESEPDPERASRLAAAARRRAGFLDRWVRWDTLALPEELDATQRRVAEVFARRSDARFGGFGLPASPRRLRQWLGLDAPSVLDRRVPHTHGGESVSWALWKVLAEADDADLEYGQGVTARIVELLTPAELIAFAAEETLEGLSVASVLETRVMGALDAHAAEAAGWAAGFADVLAPIRSPDRPHAREDAVGYDRVGLYHWDTLAVLTLLPLVRAGVALDPRWDVIAPFYGPPAMVREILAALPPERREEVLYRRLTTDWGASGERALNGFHEGLALLDLAPSERVARVVVQKYRNNRKFFAKAKEKILARFEALAAKHPGVAAALRPQRAPKAEAPARKKPAAKRKPVAKRKPAGR